MLKVFLVDDEYYERLSLKNSIPWQELGMEVSGEANNGLTAYEMILKNPPDIAIVDINMPKLNGLELIERLIDIQIICRYIILTGYDDFKYAQQAIHLNVSEYILKPINYPTLIASLTELSKKIQKQHCIDSRLHSLTNENEQFYLERYYNDLVNCNFSIQTMEQYDKKLAQELFLTYAGYCVAVLESQDNSSLDALYNLKKIYSDFYDRSQLVVCLDSKRRIFFIINHTFLTAAPGLITDLLTFAERENLPCYAGIGNSCSQLENLYLSYNEACIALQNHSIRKTGIIYYSEIHDAPVTCLDSKKKNALRAIITGKDIEKLQTFLSDLYTSFEIDRLPWDVITLRTLELINFLTECLSSQMAASISIFNTGVGILDALNSKKDINELLNWLIEVYLTAMKRITEKDTYSDITHCVESYIQTHYADAELSIAAIARDLFLNYSYLCHCFKRDKQMTINEYINQVRINKALELFQNDMENISFVAEKTGFSSASYFSKQFKKSTGLSPSEYLKTLYHNL